MLRRTAPVSLAFTSLLVVGVGVCQCTATQLTAAAFGGCAAMTMSVLFLTYCGVYCNAVFLPIHRIMRPGLATSVDDTVTPRTPTRVDPDRRAERAAHDSADPSPLLASQFRSPTTATATEIDEAKEVLRPLLERYPTRTLACVLVFLYLCYFAANACYIVALSSGMLPSIAASIFAVCPVLVVALSWLLLHLQPTTLHWAALVAGVGGVLGALQPWKAAAAFGGSGTGAGKSPTESAHSLTRRDVSIVCAVLSPVFAATYKVVFAKYFAGAKWFEAGQILGCMSGINLVVGTAIMAIVFGTGLEAPFWLGHLGDVPAAHWALFVAANAVALLFNLLVNWGVTIIVPLYVSVGTVLATVCNTFVDAAFGRGWPEPVAWVGIGAIIASFVCVAVAQSVEMRAAAAAAIASSTAVDVSSTPTISGE